MTRKLTTRVVLFFRGNSKGDHWSTKYPQVVCGFLLPHIQPTKIISQRASLRSCGVEGSLTSKFCLRWWWPTRDPCTWFLAFTSLFSCWVMLGHVGLKHCSRSQGRPRSPGPAQAIGGFGGCSRARSIFKACPSGPLWLTNLDQRMGWINWSSRVIPKEGKKRLSKEFDKTSRGKKTILSGWMVLIWPKLAQSLQFA